LRNFITLAGDAKTSSASSVALAISIKILYVSFNNQGFPQYQHDKELLFCHNSRI